MMTHRVAALIAAASLALAPAAARADATSDYNAAVTLGTQAYEYGVPLLDTQRIFSTATSITVPDGQGRGPVNQFSNVRVLADASERIVNAPNNDTPYSMAWLDVSRQPVVLHAPPIKDRFWEFATTSTT
jgi:DNA sulfur modification protein DndE